MVHLNFARAPFRNERLPMMVYGLACALLLALSVIHGITLTRYLLREQEELDSKVDKLREEVTQLNARTRRTEGELDAATNETRAERIRFLTNLYRQKSFSWTGLFNELEALTPAGVRITSISPEQIGATRDEVKKEIQVNLQVMARSHEDVLEMVRRLERNRYLTTVLPLRESEGAEGGGTIAAALSLQYVRPEKDAGAAEAGISPAREGDARGKEQEDQPEGNKELLLPVSGAEAPVPPSGLPKSATRAIGGEKQK